MSSAGASRSIVPSSRTHASHLINHPRIASHPPNNQFEINMMGDMIDYDFYIPDVSGDPTDLAFRVETWDTRLAVIAAYNAANAYNASDKEVCSYVGSVLCSVIPGFRNSIETALNGIGIRPRFISLPSQLEHQNNINISMARHVDWSYILSIFGYCILTLFKIDNKLFSFKNYCRPYSLNKFYDLMEKVGCPSTEYIFLPFRGQKEYAIRTMLGTQDLRNTVITFLINNLDHPDSMICNLCRHLRYVLSWSGDMRVFAVINERLVKTNFIVLSQSLVKEEVDNLEETMKAIASHTYPQYFSHLCSVSELILLDVSRFRTLFAVALEMDRSCNGSYAFDFISKDISKADRKTIQYLLKLHCKAMEQNRFSKRCLPTIPGI